MILETDFLDHWKTRLLIDTLNDELASNYVLRLWFHCQNRKTIYFPGMTPQMLKAICRFPGDGKILLEALHQCGFIEVEHDTISVPKYAEINSKMVSNWANGKATADSFKKRKLELEKANGRPTIGQSQAKGGADSKDSKVSKDEEEGGKEIAPHRVENPFEKPPAHQPAINPIARFSEKIQQEAREAHAIWYFWSCGSLPNIHSESVQKDLNRLAAAAEAQPDTISTRLKEYTLKPPKGWPRDAPLWKVLKHLGYDADVKPSVNIAPWEIEKERKRKEGEEAIRKAVYGETA